MKKNKKKRKMEVKKKLKKLVEGKRKKKKRKPNQKSIIRIETKVKILKILMKIISKYPKMTRHRLRNNQKKEKIKMY